MTSDLPALLGLGAPVVLWYSDFSSRKGDLRLFLTCLAWHIRAVYLELLGLVLSPESAFAVGLVGVALVVLYFFRDRLHFLRKSDLPVAKKTEEASIEAIMRPLIFPCRTSHTRFFPKKHSFSYSYLFVGIPIGWQGSIKSIISADHDALRLDRQYLRRGWLSVEAEDYLDRGNSQPGLRGKLDIYLLSQDVKPEDYPVAYLITAPRFLGYSFNPVSFWYLYSEKRVLKAMILEVNNTFDERRMYFMKSDVLQEPESMDGDYKNDSVGTSNVLKHSWAKDFHVSPFNSRKGSYSLAAINPSPFVSHPAARIKVSNSITLSSSKGHPKLVARIYSTGETVDPEELTTVQFLRFIASWWWVGLVTLPRIIREASKLFFIHKLNVWYRPEVLNGSIGRNETKEEGVLETYFRLYLENQVREVGFPLKVKYISAGRQCCREEVFKSNREKMVYDNEDLRERPKLAQELEFKVLTPAFYSNLVGYAHILETLDGEYLCSSENERTIWVSNPHLMARVFDDKSQRSLSKDTTCTNPSFFERTRWKVLRRLRRSPDGKHDSPSIIGIANTSYTATEIRNLPLSSMDRFVLSECTGDQMREYRRAAFLVLLSNWIAFGDPRLFRLMDWIVRGALAYIGSLALLKIMTGPSFSDLVEIVTLVVKLGLLETWRRLKGII